jgi:hypothetical protein
LVHAARNRFGRLHIYEQLGLPDFAVVRPALERYIASLQTYRTNVHPTLSPALKAAIASAWRQSFETWSYMSVRYLLHRFAIHPQSG